MKARMRNHRVLGLLALVIAVAALLGAAATAEASHRDALRRYGRWMPTPTGLPPAPTPEPPPPIPLPTATLSIGKGYPEPCPQLARSGVPGPAVEQALARPSRVMGWATPVNPNVPVSPFNPRQRWLSVNDTGKPYHPLFNGLVFKGGCP